MISSPSSIASTNAAPENRPGEPFVPRSWLNGGMAILNAIGEILDVNEALLAWLEIPLIDIVGQSFWEKLATLSPDWRDAVLNAGNTTDPFARGTLKFTPAGSDASQWFTLQTARHGDRMFVHLDSILPPLSELEESVWDEHLGNESARRELFLRLVQAEAQLHRLMHRWPCVIFSQRPDFGPQFVSPNIQELTGVSAEQWTAQPRKFWQMVHELDAGELQQQFKRAAQTGIDTTTTFRIRHAVTGRVTYILEHRQPTISQNGLLLSYEVVWLDVTRQTIAEKRLSTAAWKETLATLTLGMAHDFRNIMAGIHSLSESYLMQLEAEHPFHEGLGLIKNSSLQASQLVQRMINLHLGQTGERNYHDLNEVARDLMELIGKILPRRIKLVTTLAEDTLPVYVDLVELRQVIINLLLNAADAMPASGSITMRTSRHDSLPVLEHSKGTITRAPCICLTIEDTGCGIRERHLKSIFDPFFTTKAKGSGLGLYNARIAVEKHQGAIAVESREGAGTSFQIWLPQTDFSETELLKTTDLKRQSRRSLLLIGHTGEYLDKTAEFLRSHNHHVVIATEPESLPELLQSNDYQFDGVMLLAEPHDGVLAAMLGEVRQQKQDLKVILKLAGCNQDELDTGLMVRTDLMLNSDVSEAETLAQLEKLWH